MPNTKNPCVILRTDLDQLLFWDRKSKGWKVNYNPETQTFPTWQGGYRVYRNKCYSVTNAILGAEISLYSLSYLERDILPLSKSEQLLKVKHG